MQTVEAERARVESDEKQKLNKLREQLELEFQSKSEDLDKKHAYKLEQLRQQLADKHDKVGMKIFLDLLVTVFYVETSPCPIVVRKGM
jgi:hypothetical protein